ncbi:MAG: hypothetical protein ABI972_03035 [Acidobacteriota bacterium]
MSRELSAGASTAHSFARNGAAGLSSSARPRLAFGAIAQILSNDDLPASVRARAALAVLERGNSDSSASGVPDPALELDAELPKPAVAALAAEARKLCNFTPQLDAHLTAERPAARHLAQKPDGRQEANIVHTAA